MQSLWSTRTGSSLVVTTVFAIQKTTFHDAAMSQNPGTLGSNPRISFIRMRWPVYETSGRYSKTKHFCQLPIWAYPGWIVLVRMHMLMPVAGFYRLSVGTINKLSCWLCPWQTRPDSDSCSFTQLKFQNLPSCHVLPRGHGTFTKRWVHPSAWPAGCCRWSTSFRVCWSLKRVDVFRSGCQRSSTWHVFIRKSSKYMAHP